MTRRVPTFLLVLASLALAMPAPPARAQPWPSAAAAEAEPAAAPPASVAGPSAAEERAATASERAAERQRAASQWLRARVPPSLTGSTFLALEAWQWVFLWAAFGAGLLLAMGIRLLVSRWMRSSIHRDGAATDAVALKRATKPLGLVAAAMLWHHLLPIAGLDDMALQPLLSAVRLFGVVMGAWAAFRIADYISAALARRAARTESKLDDLLVPLVRTSIKGGACVAAFIGLLQGLGVSVGPLVASVGLGGLAVAFAAKDTIENFFGSLAVIVDRPFEVGDTIVVAGVTGEVLEVGFRSTRLRTPSGSHVTLPNATLVRANVERMGALRSRAATLTLRLDPSSRPDDIAAACEEMRAMLRANSRVLADNQQVRLVGSNEWGLELLVQANLDVEAKAQEMEVREEVLMASLRILQARGLRLAGSRAGIASC